MLFRVKVQVKAGHVESLEQEPCLVNDLIFLFVCIGAVPVPLQSHAKPGQQQRGQPESHSHGH